MSNLDQALDLAEKGYSIIPVHAPETPLPPGGSPTDSGKIPLIAWRDYQYRLATPDEIRTWWHRYPQANIGVVTGEVSGIIVLDVDGETGDRALRELPSLPETCQVATGRGRHFWFKHPGGHLGNSTNLLPGLDLRADGGYVVVPPSLHRTGQRYTWQHSDGTPLADPPGWLIELIMKPFQGPADTDSTHIQRIQEGSRNDTLFRLGRRLRKTGLSRGGIDVALEYENRYRCDPPLPVEEVASLTEKAATQADRPDFQLASVRNSFPPPKSDVGNETNFAPVRADALLAEPMEPMIWVWEPFIPQGGLVLLSAFMKVGKSTLLYPLALAVARGNPFLGYPTKQGGVLILAVEEHPRDVRARLENIGLTDADPIYVHRGILTQGASTLEQVRTFIVENQIVFVVLDTLATYWGIEEENDNGEVIRRCRPFLDLARGTECAVLLVHHDRKSGGEDGRSIRGGSALLGLVDQALMLDRRQGGAKNQRVLRSTGRYAETPQEMVIEWNGKEYVKIGTSDELSDSALDEKVFQAIDDQPRTVEELVARSKLTEKTVRKALDRVRDRITQEGAGVKGNPLRFRLPTENSFHFQDHSYREETDRAGTDVIGAP